MISVINFSILREEPREEIKPVPFSYRSINNRMNDEFELTNMLKPSKTQHWELMVYHIL